MGQFPSTQWLLVEMAGGASDAIAREATNQLLQRYWQPMYVHLVYKGLSPEAAEDLLQDFILEILEKNLLAIADQKKGKFRTLLLTALDRFAISKHRYHSAAKRSPKDLRSLNAGEGTDVADAEASPSLAYERAWALDVLAETLAAMRQECEDSGEAKRWTVFDRRVLAPLFEDAPAPEYSELAADLKLAGEKAAMNLLVTAKRQFARILRELVREYITQTGGHQITAELTQALDKSNDAAASATRQLAEHTIVQAVEREIAELQQIFSRPVDISALPPEKAVREDDSNYKQEFWKRLTQRAAAAPGAVGSMLDVGSVLTEGGLEAWFTDLMNTDVRRLLGENHGASGPVGQILSQPSPEQKVLEHLKEWANVQRFTLSASPQGKLADALYFLCIAAGEVLLKTRISGMNDQGLRMGYEWVDAQDWIDGNFRALARQALAGMGMPAAARA